MDFEEIGCKNVKWLRIGLWYQWCLNLGYITSEQFKSYRDKKKPIDELIYSLVSLFFCSTVMVFMTDLYKFQQI
jgi:hypothetical protein